MERLSYETQRQLPRSPPPQLLPAYREIRAPRRRPDPFPPFSAEWIEQTCNTRGATPDTRSPTATRAAFALIDRGRAVAETRYRCISAPPRPSALIFGPPGRCVTHLRWYLARWCVRERTGKMEDGARWYRATRIAFQRECEMEKRESAIMIICFEVARREAKTRNIRVPPPHFVIRFHYVEMEFLDRPRIHPAEGWKWRAREANTRWCVCVCVCGAVDLVGPWHISFGGAKLVVAQASFRSEEERRGERGGRPRKQGGDGIKG